MDGSLSVVMIQLAPIVLSAVMTFEGVQVGDTVPPFKLEGADGQVFDSTERLKDKIAVIAFWRLEQVYSERLLHDLQKLREKSETESLAIVAICTGEVEAGQVSAMAKRLNVGFPVLLDPDGSLYGKFGVIVSPATGFIDNEGKLRFYYASYRRDFLQEARANVDFLLGRIAAEEREERTKPKITSTSRPDSAGTHYRLGMQLLRQGSLEKAREELLQAWQGEPRMAAAGVELGLLLLHEGENEEALEVLSKAAELAPNAPRATGGKAVALLRAGKEEGGQLLKQALEQSPGEPLFYYEMGVLSEKRGDAEDASRYFKEGLEVAIENLLSGH